MDGRPLFCTTPETSTVLTLLAPETTYTFTVKAIDSGGNWSPLSDSVTATTGPVNSADVTPPPTPNLGGGALGTARRSSSGTSPPTTSTRSG